MALVYEARRESLAGVSPRVAIKLILPDYARSETFRELFINEARLGAEMHHQNLVQVQHFDQDEDRYFLVMEYVEGLTLAKLISLCTRFQEAVPLPFIAEMGRQACDGLHYAHTAVGGTDGKPLGLVHRDIKPSNLILNTQGVLKILDFGISKGVFRPEREGSVKGTWGYMAPEQAMGRQVSPATDIFGLGVVLFELAALHPMFKGKEQAEIRSLLNGDHAVRSLQRLDPRYAALGSVLAKALHRDPAARYRSAEEFGRALSGLIEEPIGVRDDVRAFYQAVDVLGRPSANPSSPSSPPRSVRGVGGESAGLRLPKFSSGTMGSIIAVVLSVLVLGLVVQVTFGERPERVAPVVEAPSVQRAPPAQSVGAPEPSVVPEPFDGEEAPVRVVVVRPEPEPEVVPEAVIVSEDEEVVQETPEGMGLLEIGSIQAGYEVYIDGSYVRPTPGGIPYPSGRHAVAVVARDGVRKVFTVDLVAGERIRRIWDFERLEWR
jgi:serine/threonine protein kinase